MQLEKRLAALEELTAPGSPRHIWRNVGETEDQAIARESARHPVQPHDSIVIYSWQEAAHGANAQS